MATLLQIAMLEQDERFKMKAKAAIIVAAGSIRGEDPATAQHAQRLLWAAQVFQSPGGMRDRMMPSLLQNGTLQTNGADSLDNDIQYVVNVSVDDYLPAIPV